MMRLPPFRHLAPETVEEALRLKRDGGPAAMYVAGGTDLFPNMKRRHQTPRTVISVRRLRELRGIRLEHDDRSATVRRGGSAHAGATAGAAPPAAAGEGDAGRRGWLAIGAGEVLNDVAADARVRAAWPAFAHAVESISTPILRNMGTVGGNVLLDTRCTYYNQNLDWRRAVDYCLKRDGTVCWVAPASPRCWAVQSADTAPVLVAIGAEVTLLAANGGAPSARRIPAAELYRDDGIDYLAKHPDELLSAVHLPPNDGSRAVYLKLRRRGAFDFPVLGVAAWARFAGDGTVADARIVLGGVGSYPIPVAAAGRLVGSRLEPDVAATVAEEARRPSRPLDNTDFTLSWRKEMVKPFVERALRQLAVAGPGEPS
jgi:4-hydroxybenzoyl-CoA reductase subunit beta